MVKKDSKVSSPLWDFSEYQMLFDIERTLSAAALDANKANKKVIISRKILALCQFCIDTTPPTPPLHC